MAGPGGGPGRIRYAVPARLRLVPALVAALVVAGCSPAGEGGATTAGTGSSTAGPGSSTAGSGSSTTTGPAPGSSRSGSYPRALTDEEVTALVTAMDEALAAGDVEAFLAHVAPELQEDQRAWFEAVGNVPMQVRQLRADRVISRQSPTGTVLHVGLRHQIAGGDPVPLLEQYRWVLAPDAQDRPVLVEARGRNGEHFGHPQLWDLGPVAALEGEGVLVLAPEEAREEAELLLPGLELAASRVLRDFPSLAERREVLTVQLAPAEHLATMLGTDVEDGYTGGLLWLHTSGSDPGAERLGLGRPGRVVSPRVVLDLDLVVQDLVDLGPAPQGDPWLRYFGSGAALQGDDLDRYPVEWLALGVPEWYSVLDDPVTADEVRGWVAQWHDGSAPEELPAIATTTTSDPEEVAATATGFVLYLAEAFGTEPVLELSRGLAPLDGWHDDVRIREVLTGTLGASEEELLEGWSSWLAELEESGPASVESR